MELTKQVLLNRGFREQQYGPHSGCADCAFSLERDCSHIECDGIIWLAPKDGNANVRHTDPDTSKQAEVQTRTKRASIKDHILTALAIARNGMTGTEIAAYYKLRLNSVTPRFAELTEAGKIKDSGVRRNREIVWVLV